MSLPLDGANSPRVFSSTPFSFEIPVLAHYLGFLHRSQVRFPTRMIHIHQHPRYLHELIYRRILNSLTTTLSWPTFHTPYS